MPSKIGSPGTPLPPSRPPPQRCFELFLGRKAERWKFDVESAKPPRFRCAAGDGSRGWGKAAQRRTITDPHTFTASEVQLRGSPAGSGCTREAAAAPGGEPPRDGTLCARGHGGCAACPAPAHSAAPQPPPPSPALPQSSQLRPALTEPPRVSAVCWHGPAGTAGLPCPTVPTGDVKSHWEPTRAPGVTETQNGPAWEGPQGS